MFDPDWDPDDLAAALDWSTEQANTCKGCGHPLDEVMAEGRDQAYDAVVVQCHGCAAGERAMTAFRKQDGADTAGVQTRIFERASYPEAPDQP